MTASAAAGPVRQHLIDPEICIRCNTCEATCPVGAITHDSRNYVVDVSICNWCNACVPPCPTGSIDNYRTVPSTRPYTLDEQFSWDELPAELSPEMLQAALGEAGAVESESTSVEAVVTPDPSGETPFKASSFGASVPPWSAARRIHFSASSRLCTTPFPVRNRMPREYCASGASVWSAY